MSFNIFLYLYHNLLWTQEIANRNKEQFNAPSYGSCFRISKPFRDMRKRLKFPNKRWSDISLPKKRKKKKSKEIMMIARNSDWLTSETKLNILCKAKKVKLFYLTKLYVNRQPLWRVTIKRNASEALLNFQFFSVLLETWFLN